MTDETEEIEPCAFCGKDPSKENDERGASFACVTDGCAGEYFPTYQFLAWNEVQRRVRSRIRDAAAWGMERGYYGERWCLDDEVFESYLSDQKNKP